MYYYRIDHWKARLVILVLFLSYVCGKLPAEVIPFKKALGLRF